MKNESKSRNPDAKRPDMEDEIIKRAVCEKYSRVATHPSEEFSFPVGLAFAKSVGYSSDELGRLPAAITESFTGAHNPLLFADIKPGESVLDLGCGAGLDMYFAAVAVGPGGFVHGLDISADMIGKASDNLTGLGIRNVAFHCAAADSIPLPSGAVDIVVSNGVYNLSPNKEAIVAEVFRVLKLEGRTVLSEIILKEQPQKKEVCDLDDWFR